MIVYRHWCSRSLIPIMPHSSHIYLKLLTKTFDYMEQLINVGISWKERLPCQHLGYQTAYRPDINGSARGGEKKTKG